IVGTPSIILAQNKRELTHFFASEQNGFINIGLGKEKSLDDIKNVFTELVSNYDKRVEMHSKMKKQNVLNGKRKVIKIINDLIEEL
ncbi:MAG: hypothetical protein JKY53_08905, partial [Flavobacteriales bacterium]|nr:hypothetical protein [Flavobacteriales bacterium]